MILEIRHHRFMWVVGVLTSAAAMWVFFRQGLYASFGLNTYYLITAFIGLWQWGRDKKKVASSCSGCEAGSGSGEDVIPLWMTGSPIRTSTDHCLLTAPRGVSPFAASFFASLCLGIRHTLFLS